MVVAVLVLVLVLLPLLMLRHVNNLQTPHHTTPDNYDAHRQTVPTPAARGQRIWDGSRCLLVKTNTPAHSLERVRSSPVNDGPHKSVVQQVAGQ
jgi:hypothetical protein